MDTILWRFCRLHMLFKLLEEFFYRRGTRKGDELLKRKLSVLFTHSRDDEALYLVALRDSLPVIN